MGTTSYPETLNEVIDSIGAAGRRLNDIDAVEAGAGNISAGKYNDGSKPVRPMLVAVSSSSTTSQPCRCKKWAISSRALRDEAPDVPDDTAWYLPIRAMCRNLDFICKLHH